MKRTWVEISRARLEDNVQAIRRHLRGTSEIMAVVKANAYGHGIEPLTRALLECGVKQFAVANVDEAIELRSWHDGPILVLGGCLEGEANLFRQYDLTATLFDTHPFPEDIKVQVEIDTGMTRLGIPWTDAGQFLRASHLNITGVYSHFASADTDLGFSLLQLKRFQEATEGLPYPRHICNSGSLHIAASHLDLVRVGLALYGIRPCREIQYVRPILRWKTRVIAVNDVPAGRVVGYGGTFTTHRKTRIGVLPVGYADGFNRGLSNRGFVRIGRDLCPVAGRVSMDLACVDLGPSSRVQVGDEVNLMEDYPDSPLSAENLAHSLNTIPYEVLTSIGKRVERVMMEAEVPEAG